jgi:GTP-binding protein YchF
MLRAGLIGFPSSGKTTLFQLMTSVAHAPGRDAKSDATVGIARVPDARLDTLTAMFNPKKHVPATVEFVDIANPARSGTTAAQALLDVAPYRNADALLHVVRAFRDESVPHPKTTIDPARDAREMEEELILADLGVVERRLERLERDLKKQNTPELRREQEVLRRCKAQLDNGRALRALELNADDARRLRGFQLLSAKPLLIVLNIDEADLGHADVAVERAGLHTLLASGHTRAVPVCARIELEIAQLEPADAEAFMADLALSESGLDRVIRAGYDLLGYISFFTVGEDECRAWSIPRGTNAQAAAGEIHTDLARGFIRAEVVPYASLVARGSLHACKEHGELRLEGKEYVVQDGDVVNIRHSS